MMTRSNAEKKYGLYHNTLVLLFMVLIFFVFFFFQIKNQSPNVEHINQMELDQEKYYVEVRI